MSISNIDHVAVTTGDLARLIAFYGRVLGAVVEEEHAIGGLRSVVRVRIGGALLNFHRTGHGHPLVAALPTPGAADLCFRWADTADAALTLLADAGVSIVDGPSPRRAADGQAAQSVYFVDPDGNLIELLTSVSA